jgi:hypothetical protein
VHLASATGVGLAGAAGVAGVLAVARTDAVPELSTLPFAVLGAVVGLVLLVVALR